MGDPRFYGVGAYGVGLYSRNYTDVSAVVVMNIEAIFKAQRVREPSAIVDTDFQVSPRATAYKSVVSSVGAHFTTEALPHRVAQAKSSTIAGFDVYSYGERVKNAVSEIPLDIEFAAGFVRVDARSEITLVFDTYADANITAGAISEIAVWFDTEAFAVKTASGMTSVLMGVEVDPYATALFDISSVITTSFTVYSNAEPGSFWNEKFPPQAQWNPITPDDDIWVPVNRERPFDG